MAKITIGLAEHRYDAMIEPGVLGRLGQICWEAAPSYCCALIADEHVHAIYGRQAEEALHAAGFQVLSVSQPGGEQHKNLDTVRKLYDALLDAKLERNCPLVSLGGGVNGDTVGFVAATYLRGVPFVQCPTTLLSMVDASVGGKVGVNVPQGKNLIGSFYQPRAIVIDPRVLYTLAPRELRCGLAECVKHAVIQDAALFAWLEENLDAVLALREEAMTALIERNVAIKARVVEQDEKESGLRGILNFGHTFAHAIEATSGYGVLEHGEAVALGMVAAADLAIDLGFCGEEVRERLVRLLGRIGLPDAAELAPVEQLMSAMSSDKKRQNGKLRFVLPLGIGSVRFADDVDEGRIIKSWQKIRKE